MAKLLFLSLSLYLLAWYLNSIIQLRKPPMVNDDRSEFFDPHKVKLPVTEADIVDLVLAALKSGHQVRVLGSGHSRNSLSYSRDVIVSLERFKGVVDLDKPAQQVTVRAGTTLWEMMNHLDTQGLALGVLPAILEQTVAGAIATGTHGMRADYGNLATLVTKLKMVTGEGKVVTLTATDDNLDVFRASQVSLGLLGIITEVTFKCEPSFHLEETMKKHSIEDCLKDLGEIAHSAEHVKLWLEMYSGSCDIHHFRRTKKAAAMSTVIMWRNLKMHLWEPFLWVSSWLPSLAPTLIRNSVIHGGVFHPEYTQVGNSFEILAYPLYVPQNTQAEFSVEVGHCAEALAAVKKEMEAWKPAGIFIEVRFVSPDDIWLSMNYQRFSCHITIIIYNPSAKTKAGYFSGLHQSLREIGVKPRPHFGKFLNISVQDLQEVYPKYSDFVQVRRELDPKDMFLNDMLAGLFAP